MEIRRYNCTSLPSLFQYLILILVEPVARYDCVSFSPCGQIRFLQLALRITFAAFAITPDSAYPIGSGARLAIWCTCCLDVWGFLFSCCLAHWAPSDADSFRVYLDLFLPWLYNWRILGRGGRSRWNIPRLRLAGPSSRLVRFPLLDISRHFHGVGQLPLRYRSRICRHFRACLDCTPLGLLDSLWTETSLARVERVVWTHWRFCEFFVIEPWNYLVSVHTYILFSLSYNPFPMCTIQPAYICTIPTVASSCDEITF